MENKWPEKKTHKPLPFIVIPEGHELNDLMKHNYEVGWNACHEQFMKVINEQPEVTKEALLEIFKLYTYEEILNDGKQCFVADVDGLLSTIVHKFGTKKG